MPVFANQPEAEIITRYIEEQVTKYLPGFYTPDMGDYWGYDSSMNMHTSRSDLPIAIDQIQGFTRDLYGSAAIWNGKSTDIPTVDFVIGKLPPIRAAILVSAMTYDEFDLYRQTASRTTQTWMPSVDLISTKTAAVGEFIDRREHEIILYGYKPKKMYGLYNQPIDPHNITTNFYTANPDQVYDAFLDLIYRFKQRTFLSSGARIEIKIPSKLVKVLSKPYSYAEIVGTSSARITGATTIWSLLTDPKQNGYFIGKITSADENEGIHLNNWINENSKDGAPDTKYPTTKDRIIFKVTSPDSGVKTTPLTGGFNNNKNAPTLMRHFFPRRMMPTKPMGYLSYHKLAFSATTALWTPRKNRLMYVDFPNGNT